MIQFLGCLWSGKGPRDGCGSGLSGLFDDAPAAAARVSNATGDRAQPHTPRGVAAGRPASMFKDRRTERHNDVYLDWDKY